MLTWDNLHNSMMSAVVPEFSDFLNQVRKVCNANGQKGPLDQRIALLESVVAESEKNSALVEESLDLISCSKDGYHFIIADLTDPLLSKEEANGLFQVLTEQFRTLPTKGGKVLCLDEAHKYMTGDKADGLSEAIVNVARLMRHDGVRLVVSTQSPKALAPELLELVTVAVRKLPCSLYFILPFITTLIENVTKFHIMIISMSSASLPLSRLVELLE